MAMTEKKKNRRLRKRVRKTSAIMLLVTSIIVAAIPVPENVAAPTATAASTDPNRQAPAYEYDENKIIDLSDAELFPGINLDASTVDSNDMYRGYSVFEFDGNYISQRR